MKNCLIYTVVIIFILVALFFIFKGKVFPPDDGLGDYYRYHDSLRIVWYERDIARLKSQNDSLLKKKVENDSILELLGDDLNNINARHEKEKKWLYKAKVEELVAFFVDYIAVDTGEVVMKLRHGQLLGVNELIIDHKHANRVIDNQHLKINTLQALNITNDALIFNLQKQIDRMNVNTSDMQSHIDKLHNKVDVLVDNNDKLHNKVRGWRIVGLTGWGLATIILSINFLSN
jgi:hypothetical protein